MYLDETYIVVGLKVEVENTNIIDIELENEHGDTFTIKTTRENVPKIFDKIEFTVIPK